MPPAATVDAAWLAAHLRDPHLRVVEVDVSRGAYDTGHIPGAVLWNAYADLRDASYQPVDETAMAELFTRSGISADTTVVVYGYAAPLGFWLLRASGLEDVRLLDGPRDAWVQSSQEWTTEAPAPFGRGHTRPVLRHGDIATRDDVRSAIDDPGTVIVDVRSPAEYSGQRFWPSGATENTGRTGHVPGAVSVPIDLLRDDRAELRDARDLQRAFDDAGVSRDKAVITYCTIGNRAAQAWYALKYVLGYPDVRVYYGSWVDWGNQEDTPVDT